MTADELARLLRCAAEKGDLKKEKMEHFILFGIKYADELDEKISEMLFDGQVYMKIPKLV